MSIDRFRVKEGPLSCTYKHHIQVQLECGSIYPERVPDPYMYDACVSGLSTPRSHVA